MLISRLLRKRRVKKKKNKNGNHFCFCRGIVSELSSELQMPHVGICGHFVHPVGTNFIGES